MADIFGHSKTVHGPQDLATTSAVLVRVGSGTVKLAQSVRIDYRRTVNPQYELGSEDVYLTIAPASGTCSIERLVGAGGALAAFKGSDPCKLESITVASSSAACGSGVGTISMKGICTDVGFNAAVGQFTVTDSANYTIGNLDVGG